MPKFKFNTARKNKFNFFKDCNEIIDSEISGIHTEIFCNKKIIIEGCQNIVDYQSEYIKLKIKRGFLNISGTNFIITVFNDEKIEIKGKIASLEFCV